MSATRTSLLVAGAALLALVAPTGRHAVALTAPPTYTVQFLGEGAPLGMNDVGTVVGSRTDPNTLRQVPLVSRHGGGWQALPLPAGYAGGAFAVDVNDAGVIAGNAFQSTADTLRAVRWIPSVDGYAVELLPLVAGAVRSYAAAINDAGQIVGSGAGSFALPSAGAWMHSDATGTVDLAATYGLASIPVDVNDSGVVLARSQTLDLATGAIADVGLADPAIAPVTGSAINASGQIAGTSATTIPPVTKVQRFTPGVGWQHVAGATQFATASDINDAGTVAYTEFLDKVPGLVFDGVGAVALSTLIDPAVIAAGWTPLGDAALDDSSRVAVEAINTSTFLRSAMLLTPVDTVAPMVSITSPAPGATVSGTVTVTATAADAVGVASLRIEASNVATGETVVLADTVGQAAATATWQTSTIETGAYRLRAVAADAAGNAAVSTVDVTVAPATTTRVTSLSLSANVRRGVATVTGAVTVRTTTRAVVVGATVSVRWTLPDGTTRAASGVTNSRGQLSLTTSGSRGTYRITIVDVVRTGTVFDAAGSVLTRTITAR